ncbi:tripartite motif-containing protein 7 [Poecilia formosa]|uniref:Tripartite motif-containing protein 7-like n=1 Tax=Poecilia formosa TaxID=48698 RepID=A0A087X3H2_POEFO|nr:PREDICTED: tripartite motif-containing protein 7-like [Poecilia formosa]XP_007579004.1 PREDICTED: tripartite motif-containing protein 7-like [Poecilia formosa]
MSLNGSFLTEEQFTCSICLDVFTNPSSIPCGHTFCMACITRYWDGSQVCQCPLCKKTFQKRPDIQINRTLREITDQFKSMKGGGSVKDKKGKMMGHKNHNFMAELKMKLPKPLAKDVAALTGTTQSQAHSFPGLSTSTLHPTGTTTMALSVPNHRGSSSLNHSPENQHLNHHHFPHMMSYSNSRRRFTLSGAASSKNIPLCEIHNRGILLYCKSDQVCICPECEIEDHNDHDTVTVEAEWMETKMLLRDSEQDIQDMISERRRKMEQIRESVTELEMAVERETSGTVCLFSALASAIERSQAELIEVMDNSRRSAEHQADAMIHQLEKEIEELQRREAALAELAQSEDHVHCVKTFPSLSTPPVTKNWTGVSLNTDLGTAAIYRSLAATVEKFQRDLRNILEHGFPSPILEASLAQTKPRERKMQDFALNVTLDSNTAHPRLVLSEDLKSVWCGDRHHHVPDTPERFDRVVCVLGREAISHGKHYWEVEVNGKTDWDLGVARQSVNRKGKIDYTPNNGFWFLSLRDKHKYAFRSEPCTDVEMNLRPHKIGIFVDYEKGEVSFYNVDAKVHIYTFHDIFTENLFPFFSPCTNKSGKNEMPLIITPVQME